MKFSKNLIILISLNLIIVCNAQTWSTWTSCSYPETCDTKTELTCTNGTLARCRSNGSLPYKITLSSQCNGDCDAFNNSLWNGSFISLSCRGNCYDAILIYEYNCETNQTCKRHQHYRCYDEHKCRGIWKETSNQCSSSCGGGTRSVIRTCINQTTGLESNSCNGTFYGTINQMNISQPCNTHTCPTLPTSCSTFCGNATQTSTSTNFPVLYVTIGCGAFLFLIITVIISYVVIKKRNSSNATSSNELTSNDIYGSGNKEMNANNAPSNADMEIRDFGDMYAEIDKNKEAETKNSRENLNTLEVTSESRDVYAVITEDDKPDINDHESNNEDAFTSTTDEVYAVVSKTNKMETKNRENSYDDSTQVAAEPGNVQAAVEKK